MSDLTKCNHCQLKEIKARAKADYKKITLIPETKHNWDRGLRVLVCGLSEEPDYHRHFVAWFAQVSDRCVC